MTLIRRKLSLLKVKSTDNENDSKCISNVKVKLKTNDQNREQFLFLFSDYIYMTDLPIFNRNQIKIGRELSLSGMEIEDVENESENLNFKYGLRFTVNEGNFSFYFQNEEVKNEWKNLVENIIKNNSKNKVFENPSELIIGETVPKWQHYNSTRFCNGSNCNEKFNLMNRGHHCQADGLLYCQSCLSFKMKLLFSKSSKSKLCKLCYQIINNDQSISPNQEEAKVQLKLVFDLKTRRGKIIGWLEERRYDRFKLSFKKSKMFFCELIQNGPLLNLYKKYEDKLIDHGVMLLATNILYKSNSKYYGMLDPCQFILEHQDAGEVYLFKAQSNENCEKWIESIKESIDSFMNSE